MCVTGEIATFLKTAIKLAYDAKPEYEMLKEILLSGLEHRGRYKSDKTERIISNAQTEHAPNPREVSNETRMVKTREVSDIFFEIRFR